MFIQRRGSWITTRVDERLVLFNIQEDIMLGLNAVGEQIWNLLEAPTCVETLCVKLVVEFDVEPEVCEKEVESFIGRLAELGAIMVRDGDGVGPPV